jgi:hypothetical protein
MVALAALAIIPMGQANAETLKTYQAKVEPMNYLSKYPPSLIYSGEKDAVAFQVLNHQARAVYFVNNGEKNYIPVVSENTVNFRGVTTEGNKYSIEDAEGNTLFSGEVRLGDKPEYLVNGSNANYDEWARQLARFNSSDYIPKVEEYQQNDPPRSANYHERNSESHGRSVRGYW